VGSAKSPGVTAGPARLLRDSAGCGGRFRGHAVALDTQLKKERVNADAERVRDGASDTAGVVVLAE
jgi:hypothetical protein